MNMDTTAGPRLVAFDATVAVTASKRAERLSKAWHVATREVDESLHAAGLLPNPYISPGAPRDRMTGIHGLRCREWYTVINLYGYWERQAVKYQSLLRRAMACDGIDDEQRSAILEGLHGLKARQMDSRVLSDAERRLVDNYRHMDDRDRQMLRTLVDRLASFADHENARTKEGGAQ